VWSSRTINNLAGEKSQERVFCDNISKACGNMNQPLFSYTPENISHMLKETQIPAVIVRIP
jgi:hypothetical protein